MSYAYHGNWCGPGWSDGRYTSSVKGFAPAVDEFDETCRQHDFALVGGTKDLKADARFIRENAGRGLKRTGASVAVLARAVADVLVGDPTVNKNHSLSLIDPVMSGSKAKTNLRKAAKPKPKTPNSATVLAPVAVATKTTGAAAKVVTRANGTVEVSNKTFVGPITNSLNFDVSAYPCNPGIVGPFPWLSKVARRYEQYRFRKIRYIYRSVASSSTNGVVMMSFDYDAADVVPASKAVQSQTVPNSESNVWVNNSLTITCDNVWRFIRPGPLGANLDIKTYDLGNLFVSSCYGNNVVGGELYVEYVVEMRMPTDGPEVGGQAQFSATLAIPYGSANLVMSGAAFPFVRTTDNSLTTVISGEYLLVYRVDGAGLTGSFPTPVLTTTSVSSNIVAVISSSNVSAARTSVMFRARLQNGDILTSANCGTGTSAASVKLDVATIDYDTFRL